MEIDYSLGDLFRGKDGEPSALAKFIDKMGETLQNAVSEATTLKVMTYTSGDMDKVTYDKDTGFSGANLRAMTMFHLDGDVVACVPQTGGKIDESLWAVHLQLVERAQTSRNELFKTAVSALTGLIRPGAMS